MKLGQFAEHAGVGYGHLANIECGRQRTASFEFIYRVAAGLGMTADEAEELLGGPEPEAATAEQAA